MLKRDSLIIFVKNPQIGKVKTRLAESVGEADALAVYLKLLSHTRLITENLPVDKTVFYSEFIDSEDDWDSEVFNKEIQQGNNLGARMQNAFQKQFSKGFENICIIGSDNPELTESVVLDAFKKLNSHDAVIGPGDDGGYYLLGLKKIHPVLFEKKSWGTDEVLEATLRDFSNLNMTCFSLPTLTDIDTLADLQKIWPHTIWKEL